jgi:hypothetical protein
LGVLILLFILVFFTIRYIKRNWFFIVSLSKKVRKDDCEHK